MFGLFNKKKIHLSRADFVMLMLSFQQKTAEVLLEDAQKFFHTKIDAGILQLESEILSLCILSLAIQDNDLDLRNAIFIEYCHYRNYNKDITKQFLGHLNMRCAQYYDAFNELVKNHGTGGLLLGGVIANGLKGGESDKLELGLLNAHAASILFNETLKSAFQFIGDLKNKCDLSEVSPVFVQ
jgi:hypothetical protein